MRTHIRLDVSTRDEACAILLPIAGTTFEITPAYETIAILASGQRYTLEQSFPEIEAALDAMRVDSPPDLTS